MISATLMDIKFPNIRCLFVYFSEAFSIKYLAGAKFLFEIFLTLGFFILCKSGLHKLEIFVLIL